MLEILEEQRMELKDGKSILLGAKNKDREELKKHHFYTVLKEGLYVLLNQESNTNAKLLRDGIDTVSSITDGTVASIPVKLFGGSAKALIDFKEESKNKEIINAPLQQ